MCIPTQAEQIIGFVTDRFVESKELVLNDPRAVVPHGLSLVTPVLQKWFEQQRVALTPQEYKILAAMGLQPSKEGSHFPCEKIEDVYGSVTPGPTNLEIAEQMHLSVRTVKFHLTNIYRKLQITSRYQLLPPA